MGEEFKEILAKKLKEARKRVNLSRQELATKAGISTSALYYYEKGDQVPSAENLLSLSKVLEVSVDYLLGLTDIPIVQKFGAEQLPSYLKLLPVYLYNDKEKIDISKFPEDRPLIEYGAINKKIPADYGIQVYLENYPMFFLTRPYGIIWVDEKGKDKVDSGVFVAAIIGNKLSVREVIKDVETEKIVLASLVRQEEAIFIEKKDINSYIIGLVVAWNSLWINISKHE